MTFLGQFARIPKTKLNRKGDDSLYSIVTTAIVQGIKSVPVYVEADVSDGMPIFEMVGFLSSEVKESKERVRTALRNSGYMLPAKRITINFIPANIKKTGSGFDLPIALSILCAMGIVPEDALKDVVTRKNINTPYQKGGEASMPSTCISTDRKTLKPRKKTK